MKHFILFLLLGGVMLGGIGGCSPSEKSSKSAKSSKKSNEAIHGDMFTIAIDCLNRLEQFQTDRIQGQIITEINRRASSSKQSFVDPQSTLLALWPEQDSLQQIVDRLNQWVRTQRESEWREDPMVAELPDSFRKIPLVANLAKAEFVPFDGYYLQEAVYFRDAAQWARGKKLDDRVRANQLFDWTIRNIQLENDVPNRVPQFPWEALFFGHGTAWERAWVFILLARQEGLDAAILAVEPQAEPAPTSSSAPSEAVSPSASTSASEPTPSEEKKSKTDEAMKQEKASTEAAKPEDASKTENTSKNEETSKKEDSSKKEETSKPNMVGQKKGASGPRPWCVGVLIEGKVYLYDMQWGLPIRGAQPINKNAQGRFEFLPATLGELLADGQLLSKMNVESAPYPVKSSDLKHLEVWLEASPDALSKRMKMIESRLQGKQKMVLTASPTSQAERWKASPGITQVKLWHLPYETLQRRSALTTEQIVVKLDRLLPFYAMPTSLLLGEETIEEAAKTPKDLRNPYTGAAYSEKADASTQAMKSNLQDSEAQQKRRIYRAYDLINTTFSAPLYKGRVLYLKGQMSGEAGSVKFFQMSRPSQTELMQIRAKLFVEVIRPQLAALKLNAEEQEKLIGPLTEAVATGKPMQDRDNERLAQEIRRVFSPLIDHQMSSIFLGKQNAGYWLGISAFETGNYPSAVDYFVNRTLAPWPEGPWSTGAKYNVGRTLEAAGKIDEAVEVYEANRNAPDAAGQLLRAKWLTEAVEQNSGDATAK